MRYVSASKLIGKKVDKFLVEPLYSTKAILAPNSLALWDLAGSREKICNEWHELRQKNNHLINLPRELPQNQKSLYYSRCGDFVPKVILNEFFKNFLGPLTA